MKPPYRRRKKRPEPPTVVEFLEYTPFLDCARILHRKQLAVHPHTKLLLEAELGLKLPFVKTSYDIPKGQLLIISSSEKENREYSLSIGDVESCALIIASYPQRLCDMHADIPADYADDWRKWVEK